jgi:hypothetical protein
MRTIVLLALVLGCGKSHEADKGALLAHALPGFSVSLPKGAVLEDTSSKYAMGTYTRGVKGSWIVSINWAPGEASRSDRTSYESAWKLETAKPLAMTAPRVKTETFAGTNRGPARVSFITCGMRHIVLASIDHADVDTFHASVLASFSCTPDPAKEKRTNAAVVLADPNGWQRIGSRDDVLLLVRNGGAQTLVNLFYAERPDMPALEGLLRGYHGSIGDGDPHPVGALGGRGWLRVLTCAEDHHIVTMYVEGGGGPADRTTIDGVRCLRADEPDVAWPPAPPELQQAIPND